MKQTLEIPAESSGQRFDQAVSSLLPEYSRSRIQIWIKDGQIRLDGEICRPKDKVNGGEHVEISLVEAPLDDNCQPENIPISVIHEDKDILVVDKVAGMVVHPAAGNYSGTLQNALLFHYPQLESIPRSGIVHRLDKDTSGLLVIAKTLTAHTSLVKQLQDRSMGRRYQAIVAGRMVAGGTVDEPIGRHPVDRKRMAVVRNGKTAVTHYRVKTRFQNHTHIIVKLETGRTHQIRVHMAHIRHPLTGDPVYGGRRKIPAAADPRLVTVLDNFPRQALHAAELELGHPATGDLISWSSPLPDDMTELLDTLAEYSPDHA